MHKEKAIGGYFGLELYKKGIEFHKDLIRLNTARNAIVLILEKRKYLKVYLPLYTCGVIIDAIKKTDIEITFYTITAKLEIENLPVLKETEGLVYINYFGFKNDYIMQLEQKVPNLVIDNAQAFFSKPLKNIDTVYCPRKFFGVPDGAYLNTNLEMDIPLEKDISLNRVSHLLKRLEFGPEAGFEDFKSNEKSLENEPLKEMSELTQSILKNSIDYNYAATQRNLNYNYLHKHLQHLNKLPIRFDEFISPMVYPFLSNSNALREKLIDNRVFVAAYWPDVLKRSEKDSIEHFYTSNLVALPIDQRYDDADMKKIVALVKQYG